MDITKFWSLILYLTIISYFSEAVLPFEVDDEVCGPYNKCPRSCSDLKKKISNAEEHLLFPQSRFISEPFKALCEPGGWTVFQKRDGESNSSNPDDFFRSMESYENGFGDLNGEFWLGNLKIYALTLQEPVYMQIQMEDWSGRSETVETGAFRVLSSPTYEIVYDSFSGELGKDLPPSGTIFSAFNRENPNIYNVYNKLANMASRYKGGWWYSASHNSNLNGLNLKGGHITEGDGINWKSFRGLKYSLKSTKMRIRPLTMKD